MWCISMGVLLAVRYRIAGLFCGRNFSRILWICPRFAKILFANIACACCAHLCLFHSGCVADGNPRNFYSQNTQMPAIHENFLPRNKPTIQYTLQLYSSVCEKDGDFVYSLHFYIISTVFACFLACHP